MKRNKVEPVYAMVQSIAYKGFRARIHVQPTKVTRKYSDREWRIGVEGKTADKLGLDGVEYVHYGKSSVELFVFPNKEKAMYMAQLFQRALWDMKDIASSIYDHNARNVIIDEITFPRSTDPTKTKG